MTFRIEVHADLASTQDVCAARGRAGAPAGLAVLALKQSEGRGRAGRVWQAPQGNLNLSVLLRPRIDQRDYGGLALLAGVAAVEGIGEFLPDPSLLSLKWPNDVMLGEFRDAAKLAGVLIEAEPGFVVIGIGANLRSAPAVEGRRTASLAPLVEPPGPEQAAEAILPRIAHHLAVLETQGPAPIIEAWLARAHPLGTALSVTAAGGAGRVASGSFAGLSVRGELLLDVGGHIQAFNSGEVSCFS